MTTLDQSHQRFSTHGNRRVRGDIRPALFGILPVLMMMMQVLWRGDPAVTQVSSFVVLAGLLLITVSYRPTNSVSDLVWIVFSIFVLLMIVSNWIGLSVIGSAAFLRVSAITSFLFVGLLLAYRRDHQIIERSLPVFGIGFTLLLVYVLIDNDRLFARLRGHLHPNLWGYLIATSLPMIAFTRTGVLFKALAISFLLYLLAFEFQTRAALVWSIVGLMLFVPFFLTDQSQSVYFRLKSFFALLLLATVVGFVVMIFLDTIASDIFQIDSETRGLGSGLTGRVGLWSAAYNVFLERPIFGSGFDSGRYYATNFFQVYAIGRIESLHSSYLTAFFEMGLVGGLWYLFLVLLALRGALYLRNLAIISFVLIYLAMGLTETRQLNVGNPSGLLFLLFLPYLANVVFTYRSAALAAPGSLSSYKV